MAERIWVILCGALSIASFVISIMQFKEKGFLFNNAYILASKRERAAMNKKPHYRQSGIAFALCAAMFFFMTLACVLCIGWLWLIAGLLAIVLLAYAIASSVRTQIK